MTNAEILMMECATRGITEEVHTFARWKQMGFMVKKGEHALFSTSLWKQTKGKRSKEQIDEDEETNNGHMYMCKAFLFGESQVEKIEGGNSDGKTEL